MRCRWLVAFAQNVLAPLPGTPADPFQGVPIDVNAFGWAIAAGESFAHRVGSWFWQHETRQTSCAVNFG